MKKSFNDISGTILTEKQMKSLRGGTIIGGGSETCSGTCPIKPSYTCAFNALKSCVCKDEFGTQDCSSATDTTGTKPKTRV